AGEAVAPVPDRDGGEEDYRDVEDDDGGKGVVGEMERLLDLRCQRGEGGRVEFVEEVEEEQDDEREDGEAAGDGDEPAAGPLHGCGDRVGRRLVDGHRHARLPMVSSSSSSRSTSPLGPSFSGGGSPTRLSATRLGTTRPRRAATQ